MAVWTTVEFLVGSPYEAGVGKIVETTTGALETRCTRSANKLATAAFNYTPE